jgi:hypothetical protein
MNNLVKLIVSIIAVMGIVLHAICQNIKIDSITIALLFIALLPWLAFLLEEVEFPGGWKVKFKRQEKEEIEKKANQAGLAPDISKEGGNKYSFQLVGPANKNLALAGLRIEIEKILIDIAKKNGIGTNMQGVGRIVKFLFDKNLINFEEKAVINDMIGLLNKAVHGKKIDDDSYYWAMEYGLKLLKALRDKDAAYSNPN